MLMKKEFFLVIALFFVVSLSFAQKFAYVSTQYILNEIPEYQIAQDQLSELSEGWQGEIETAKNEVRDLYQAYQAEQVLLTEKMKTTREEEIIAKEKEVKDLRLKYFGPEGELYSRQQTLIAPIQNQIYKAVQEYAAEGRYDFIFDKSGDLIMLFANPKLDKSDVILDRMGY